MPHWSIPTQHETVNVGGTFYVNACGADSTNRTETPKKVTCKACKALIEWPNTPYILAARILEKVTTFQDEHDDQWCSVKCNACPQDIDVSQWRYDQAYTVLPSIVLFLEHCAYEHVGGAEPMFVVMEDIAPVYGLNYAMRKPAMTQAEQDWRDRTFDVQSEAVEAE